MLRRTFRSGIGPYPPSPSTLTIPSRLRRTKKPSDPVTVKSPEYPSSINPQRFSLYPRAWREVERRTQYTPPEAIPPLSFESDIERDLLKQNTSHKSSSSRLKSDESTQDASEPIMTIIPDDCLRIALVGAMNVGKSTLYNMLVYERIPNFHFVAAAEGTTRDVSEAHAKIGDIEFTILDTPGLLGGKLSPETIQLLPTCDLAFILFSATDGIREEERAVVHAVDKLNIPVVLVLNKMDLVDFVEPNSLHEYQSLRMGKPLHISLRTRSGTDALYDAITPHHEMAIMRRTFRDWNLEDAALLGDEKALSIIQQRNNMERYIRIALIGRPNSGKSTLFNSLLGVRRARESPVAETTRDTLETRCVYKGQKIKITDTPGFLRVKQFREQPFNEALWKQTRSILRFAHICIVVIDASIGAPTKGDLILGYRCIDEGKAFAYAANKWDLVGDASAIAEAIDYKLQKQLYEVKYCSVIAISAVTKQNLTLLLDHALAIFETWNKHIDTSSLTRFWKRLEKSITIPRHIPKVRKLEQVNTRPPTFMLHLQTRDDRKKLPPRYENMVRNALIEEFGFRGVPLRIFQSAKDAYKDFDE